MESKTTIYVAIIGVVGTLGAALISNWDHHPEQKKDVVTVEYSLTCKYTSGPKAGRTEHFAPGPGVTPGIVGGPCQDGLGSFGVAISDK